jgi:AcrR family transcriptional regulator
VAPTRSPRETTREPLTRERVLGAAMTLADREGIEALTIRALAAELGARPMSLYHYVAGKEALLDAMVDRVFDEIALPPADLDWRAAVRQRCVAAREVLVRHPWAVPLLESRTSPGPITLAHHDGMLATFFRAGFSLPVTAHAYAILDSYVYGFAIQQANLAIEGAGGAEVTEEIAAQFSPDAYPSLVRFAAEHAMQPGYEFGASFEVGLDLLLDGIARLAAAPEVG